MTHQQLTAAAAREVVLSRQGGLCWACCTGLRPDDAEVHHRLRRRDARIAGGEWCPCLLVALHPACHNMGPASVHGHPTWGKVRGLIVPSWEDPTTVLVWLHRPWPHAMALGCDGFAWWVRDGVAADAPPVP